MGSCQQKNINEESQKNNDQIDHQQQSPYLGQLKLTPQILNIEGDSDRMDDICFELDKFITINQIQHTTTLVDNIYCTNKLSTQSDPPSQTLDQQITKSIKKPKNLNAKFKEMIF